MKIRVVSAWAFLALAIFELHSSAANLTHRYLFSVEAINAVGGANGQLVGGAAFSGGAVVLDGASGYVNLPNNIVTGYTAVTIEAWVTDWPGTALSTGVRQHVVWLPTATRKWP